ncbi:MAG: mercury resistance system transport protein MerF [Rhodocyclaceae bacterium]
MQDPKTLMRFGTVGALLTALCCFTPILVILLGLAGLSALTGYLDYVLLPMLAVFTGLTFYAVWRRRSGAACGAPPGKGERP